MKKSIFALALASAVAAPAWAQDAVTVFGVIDVALRNVNNQGPGSISSMVSGSNATSRLGFRGVEDLGGGLSASFHLEHGLLIDTGGETSSTQFFDRRSTVSLASRALGELRLGRDYVPTYTVWSRYDPFGFVGVAGSTNFVSATPTGPIKSSFGSNPNTTQRANNTLQYLLPDGLAGLEGGLMVAPSEGGAAASGLAKVTAARLGYAAGPLNLAAAFTTTSNSLTSAGSLKDSVIGGSYNAGVVRLSLAWRQFKQASATQTNTLLAAVVPFGLSEFKFSWNRADLSGQVGATQIGANDGKQLGLGYVYNLSKRTALYASYARIDNQGVAAFAVPGGPAGLTPGGSSRAYEAGVRHNF